MSIAQPSANQIANIYQGNPGALNARIQQEQRGKPAGLPPDLTKLMALNINVNEQDAAKRQQAMSALQSMQQQGGGELPTVAQTLIEQAKQKAQIMQQQMQQMQPKPQGLMALLQQRGMPQAPENAPRPERQPSGIDELQSNIGQNFDGGGIVAFEEGGKTDDKEKLTEEEAREILRRMRQRTDMRPESMAITEMDTTSIPGFEAGTRFKEEMDRASGRRPPMTPQQMEANVKAPAPEPTPSAPREPYSGLRQVTQRELAEEFNRKRFAQQAEDAKKPEDEMLKLVKMPFKAAGQGIANLLSSLYGGKTPGATPEQTGPDMNMGEAIMQASRNTREATPTAPAIGNEAQRRPASIVGTAPSASSGIAALVSGQKPAGTKPSGITGGKPVVPAAPAAPAPVSKMDQFLASQFDKTPEERRLEAIERYKNAIGEPDTAAQERYIKQLEESATRFDEPSDFAGRLSRWARNTAAAGGRSSLETGAKGAAATYAEQQANAQKKMDVLKELMAESSKVAETKRGYKKELVLFGEKQYEETFKNAMEAAKELGLSGRKQQEFAHLAAEGALDRASRERVAGMPSGEERMFAKFAQDWASKPENKGKTMSDAYVAYKMAGSPSTQLKGVMSRNEASDNVAKKIAYDSPMRTPLMNEAKEALTKAGIASPSATQIMDYLIDKEMGKANSTATAAPTSGKVPAPPSGFKLD